MSRKRICPGKPLDLPFALADVVRLLARFAEERHVEADPAEPWTATPCWIWGGATDPDGYGFVKWRGKRQFVHRVTVQLFKGVLADGEEGDHLCFVRNCGNPNHIQPLSRSSNGARRRKPESEPAPF